MLLRRAIWIIPGVVLLVFFLFRLLGDPANLMIGQSGDEKTRNNILREYHLDKPAWKQFLYYINDISPLSIYEKKSWDDKNVSGIFIGKNTGLVIKWPYLGRSYQNNRPVLDVLLQALPATIILAISAMLLAVVGGVFLGVVAASNKGSAKDHIAMLTSIAGISAPSFFTAMIIAYIFGIWLQPYTGLHFTGSLFEINEITGEQTLALKNLILPALTLGIRPLAIITQLTRSALLDELGKDYIRTAYAKGLSKRTVIWKHALPNAINPVITAITGWFADLLTGAFFVEYIFGWNGLGKVTVNALEKLDYPVVTGAVLLSAIIFTLIQVFTDLLYRIADPRVRL